VNTITQVFCSTIAKPSFRNIETLIILLLLYIINNHIIGILQPMVLLDESSLEFMHQSFKFNIHLFTPRNSARHN